MINSLDKYFSKYNNNNLLKIIAFSTFITDLACLYYINIYWLNIKLKALVKKILVMKGMINTSSTDVIQATAVLSNSLGMMFFLFMLGHFVIYTLLFFNKKWAINYVYRYTLVTVLLTLLELVVIYGESKFWFFCLLTITLSYNFSFMALRYVRKNQEQLD